MKKAHSAGFKFRQSYVGASPKATFEVEEEFIHHTMSCGAGYLMQIWRDCESLCSTVVGDGARYRS